MKENGLTVYKTLKRIASLGDGGDMCYFHNYEFFSLRMNAKTERIQRGKREVNPNKKRGFGEYKTCLPAIPEL